MEIKITVTVGNNVPVEVKVDIPVNEGEVVKDEQSDVGVDAKWFDESCAGWTKNSETNKLFLIQQQKYFNEKLRARGYLFLNEVYDGLGMARTRRGQCVGWVLDEDNPDLWNCVSFGLDYKRNADFMNGMTDRVLLDFNVDGDILKYL